MISEGSQLPAMGATAAELKKLRGESESAFQTLNTRITGLDDLVQKINQGLKVDNENFSRVEAKVDKSESDLQDAATSFRSLNVQNLSLELNSTMQALSRVKADFDP